MRTLTPEELDRLVRSNRNLKISALVVLSLIVVGTVLLIKAETGFPVGFGAPLGVLIGLLMLIPQRRLLSELGLTTAEARAILQEERERRSGVAALPAQARASREMVRFGVYLGLGLAFVVLLCVSAQYFFERAGQTSEEDAPDDPWFGISFFAGFASLALAGGFLYAAKSHWSEAQKWREKAAATGA